MPRFSWNSVMLRLSLDFAEAFVGERGRCTFRGSLVAILRRHERMVVLQRHTGHPNQSERLGRFLAGGFEALLQGSDLVGMRGGEVVLFIRVFGEVIEVHTGGDKGAPD